MKRSKLIPLLMLGTLIAGCSDQTEDTYDVKQDQYASLDDCHKDWGDGAECDAANVTTSHGAGVVYMGPRYFYSGGTPMILSSSGVATPVTGISSSRAVSTSVSSMSVSRGGFGSSAHAAAGGEGGGGHGAGGAGGHGGSSGGG